MGVFVYRDMTLRRFVDAVISAGCSTGVVMLVIMGSSVVGWLVTYAQIPQAFAAWCMETLQDPWLIILAMNVIMLIVGMSSEESHVGKESVGTCRYRWSQY